MEIDFDGDNLVVSPVPSEDTSHVIELAAAAGMRKVAVTPVHPEAVQIVISRQRTNDPRRALVSLVALAAALTDEDPTQWLKSWQTDNQQFYNVANRSS